LRAVVAGASAVRLRWARSVAGGMGRARRFASGGAKGERRGSGSVSRRLDGTGLGRVAPVVSELTGTPRCRRRDRRTHGAARSGAWCW
jgi:hypothetical protein